MPVPAPAINRPAQDPGRDLVSLLHTYPVHVRGDECKPDYSDPGLCRYLVLVACSSSMFQNLSTRSSVSSVSSSGIVANEEIMSGVFEQ